MVYDSSVLVDNIRKLAKKQNKKMSDFERFAGVSIGYCSRLAKDGSSPSLEFAFSAESFFGVDLHELVRPMFFIDSCPHCGGEAIAALTGDLWYVHCPACGCGTAAMETKEDAVNAWNRRIKGAEP